MLPQQSGKGYYSYENSNRQFGTQKTIQAILDVGSTFQLNHPSLPIGVGDISFEDGSAMPPHGSHTDGKDVDIRPLRKDSEMRPVNISDSAYSRERTKILVESLLAHKNVQSILFNDDQIPGPTSYDGHDDHLHVNMKE